MAKGENIFRRRDGRWEARYSKGRELSGKIKYGYCYGKTYREAKEKAEKCKAALASGNPLPTSRTPNLFSAYCMGWLHAKKSKVKESTYIKYSTVVEKHIIPKLGDCCPLGFTTELMDDFIRELQFEDELAPKTVHDILVVLHGILKFTASKCKGVFPTVEINYPKIGKKEMRVLSREEQARFISYLQKDLDPCRFGILLALCTGIRIGELCALRWEYVSTRDKASKTSWVCIYRMLHGRTERFNCGQQAGGSFLEGRTTASFTFDTTILRIAALMHTRSISNVFRSYLQRWNKLSNRKPMSTCYFIRFLTRCCLLPQECLAVKCRMMMRPHSGHSNRYTALLYLTFVKSF